MLSRGEVIELYLRGIERVAHRFADKISSDSKMAGEKSRRAEPWRLQIVFPLQQQLPERRRSERQAEAEEIERGQRGDRTAENKGQPVSVATIAFGSIWRSIMRLSLTPSAMAARI